MKIDRLIAITMYLLNRETVNASALAARFEVSRRTIQRDIDTLCQAGIPIVSAYGAEGGYAIMDGFKLTKQIAGTDDSANIIAALRGLCSAYDNATFNATLEKAQAALQGGEQRIFVDFTVAREGPRINEHLRLLEKAIRDKQPLLITYVNADAGWTGKPPSSRVIEPLALSYQWYAWYLFAYCTVKQDYRLFKLARLSACEPVDAVFTMEHGAVEPLMKESTRDVREPMHIRLLCDGSVRQPVTEYLNGCIAEEYDNGDFILEMTVPMERMWFSLLMGFGNRVKVLAPDELKTLLREKAEEIFAMYDI